MARAEKITSLMGLSTTKVTSPEIAPSHRCTQAMPTSTDRVAARFLYAKLIVSMSLEEAKKTLGFSSSDQPTPQEVSKAYKEMAFKNHPDRGGDPTKMVAINVAKDILEGKGRPSYGRPQRNDPPEYTKYKYEPPPPPPPVEGKSFSQAFAEAPSGVDWKFISNQTYAYHRLSTEGTGFLDCSGWVLYGQTDSHHVFLALQNSRNSGYVNEEGAWEAKVATAPRATNLLKLAPKMIAELATSLGADKYSMPKKFMVLDGTFKQSDLKARGSLSLKDAIIGSGAMSGEETGLKGRKLVVTIEPKPNIDMYKAWVAQGKPVKKSYLAYLWIVEVNGKGRSLGDDELDKLQESYFFGGVFSYDYKGKKTLSQLRGGGMSFGAADALRILHEALHGGPLKEQVGKAAEQAAQAKKKACVRVVDKFLST
jgi:hypothetical protein